MIGRSKQTYDVVAGKWRTVYTCPQCDSAKTSYDGCLGRLVWFTCDACGWEFSHPFEDYIKDGGQVDD
jgi:ribosomal protein L37AE/L43A